MTKHLLNDIIKRTRPVSVSNTKRPVNKSDTFGIPIKKKIIGLIILGLFCTTRVVAQQQTTVKGKVTDSKGLELPGVSIKLKGTSVAVATDINGVYTINVPNLKDTLEFTFIGLTTLDEGINGRTVVNVQLNDASNTLNEVVVIGFGEVKKKGSYGGGFCH